MARALFHQVCLDANDCEAVGRFWADALGLSWLPDDDYPGGDVRGDAGTGLRIEQVPERKVGKNRAHPDIYARAIDDLVALGARVLLPEGDDRRWTVMADVEGNEFCAFLRNPVPAARLHGVELDCVDARRVVAWWGQVLGGTVTHDPRGFSTVEAGDDRPFTLDFESVPEPKVGKNRLHLDLRSDDLDGLLRMGATPLREPQGTAYWHVLADVEGNEFCVFPDVGG